MGILEFIETNAGTLTNVIVATWLGIVLFVNFGALIVECNDNLKNSTKFKVGKATLITTLVFAIVTIPMFALTLYYLNDVHIVATSVISFLLCFAAWLIANVIPINQFFDYKDSNERDKKIQCVIPESVDDNLYLKNHIVEI
jgi:hypothetical protein